MKNYIRILTMITALMFGAVSGAWALTNDDIEIEVKPSASTGNISKSISGQEVTLTVTPATGYFIRASDIVVEKLVDPGKANAPKRRTPDFTDVITGKMYSGSGRADEDIISSVKYPESAEYVFTVPADYDGAYVTATFHLLSEGEIIRITASTDLGETPDMTKHYVLVDDVSASVLENFYSETAFTGIFEGEAKADGTFPKITGLSTPLFNTLTGTVKNIMLEGVGISNHTGNTGAIACTANGAACIYNVGILSGSVGGTDNTGGLVGLLDGTARVINCYSFADITGGTNVAGIVGNNNRTSSQTALNTIVVNCMFYGNITGGTSVYPVYGGSSINNDSNTGINPYCYFRKNATLTPTAYNRSWPAEEKNLTRFDYYRSVLNSNRKLCTWWVNGTSGTAPTDEDVANVGIAKWVLDPSIAPYPILKKWGKYPSVINLDPDKVWDPRTEVKEGDVVTPVTPHWVQRSVANEWEGKSYGTLAVTINAGAHGSGSTSRNIAITDMDTLNCDYSYYKIQLPYYNEVFGNPNGATHAEKYGGNYTEYVVTGWEIEAAGSTTATDYNFADRNSINGRVFAQGGYYYVPKNVTSITITARWGKAFYLSNRGRSIDRVNVTKADYKADSPFTPAGTIPDTFQDQPVYDDLQNAIKALGTNTDSPTVYDQAIVLIGNHQVKNGNNDVGYNLDSKWHPFTIMSADFDFDNEPDYSFQFQFRVNTPRPGIQPIRFDFLPVVELGLALRHDYKAYAIGIFVPQGHFEVTETAFMRTTQFEYDGFNSYTDRRIEGKSPVIINGGEYEMFTVRYHASNRTSYFLLGGNAWIHRFAPGAHPNTGQKPSIYLCPVNVIGGEVKELYLTGLYRPELDVPNNQGAPRCYTDGGKFDIMAGAGYDKVAAGSNVTFKINHSKITEFYGGGINGSNPISGNIDVTIDNSYVDKYCGGPKVGDMTGKTVTTHATGTTFGVFFGGGNGGNSYYRQLQKDGDQNSNHIGTWTDQGYNWNNFNPLGVKDDGTDNKGYHAEYEFEVFNHSNGVTDQITQRGFIRWIQFGITKTGNVSSTLSDCKILGNFYGGGNLATVDGNVTSTLTNTQVAGSVFGAGYSAAIPTFQVHDKSTVSFPSITAGVITDGYIGYDSKVYEWTNEKLEGKDEAYMKAHPTYEKDGKWYCYTWNSLDDLGAVTGTATLTINGTTTVAESVYGGGEESGVGGDTEVNVTGGTIGTTGKGGATWGNVFGGGKGKEDDVNAGLVKGNTIISISGTPTIIHNVYGGGAFGSVGTFTYDGTTGFPNSLTNETGTANITITGGTFGSDGKENGMVFGSSRGLEGDPLLNANIDKMAWVGNTNVVIGTTSAESNANPAIKGSVYGGGENGHNYQDAHVTVHSGTIGVTDKNTDGGARYPYRGNVYGSGCGTDTYKKMVNEVEKTYYDFNAGIVLGNTQVDIDGGHIVHNVYGGGAMGSVGTYTFADAAYHDEHPDVPIGMPISCAANTGLCTINISGGQIGITDATMTGHGTDGPDDCGHVFGAGRGTSADPELNPNVETCAFFNNTSLNISGTAFICGSVYGGSESGHVLNNTNVTMSGGQIGCGIASDAPYTDDDFINQTTLYGTAHWTNEADGAPYDQYANEIGQYPDGSSAEGGKPIGTDGRTFFGNVFAGGSGYYPYAPGKWLKSAGHIGGNASVTVSGGHILNNLYGGCEMADIEGAVTVTMTGGTVGVPRHKDVISANPNYGNVYGGGMGDKRIFFNTSTNVASTTINISNGTVYGTVYGGGEDGHVMGDAVTTISQPEGKTTVIGCDGQSGYDGNVFGAGQGHVGALTSGVVGGNASLTITGGTLKGSAYGGGRIASVGTFFASATDENYGKMQEGDAHGNLSVSLTGGTIYRNVYGGCMGTAEDVAYGISKNVSVDLNKDVDDAAKGCIVLGPIFGCNNVNSSPEGTSTVHIYKTQRNGASRITNAGEVTNAKVNGTKDSNGEFILGSFDVPAVYGGGNLAAYTPKDENGTTNVIIDGCSRTSIGQVYGGGNAASTPATSVTINGTFEIGELFGGGNGKDALPSGDPNPGANVGFHAYADDAPNAQTPEDRAANYGYGSGQAAVNIYGGTIHRVFGGSNTKGNVRKTAITMLEEVTEGGLPVCEFHVDEAYGGGKSALMDAEAKLLMACIPGLEEVYGGAQAADIHDDVTLTITNGTFNRVFGGNNLSGTIDGSITVNVEEVGCRPIIIGELYGGGNLAAYSIYGYEDGGTPKTTGENPHKDPEINVKSFTSIGSIYGGGFGEPALMVGSPTVNINEVADPESDAQNKSYIEDAQTKYYSDYPGETKTIAGHSVILPSHAKGKMGAIHTVFGGGNAAKVMGNTTVNIGTTVGNDIYIEIPVKAGATLPADCYTKSGDEYTSVSGTAEEGKEYYKKYIVLGVDIRDNIYGGGNNAEVTGNTNVNIGKSAE